MFNLIYIEFFKLRSSYIKYIVLLSAMFNPILMILTRKVLHMNGTTKFKTYLYTIDDMNALLVFILFFSLIAVYVYNRETSEQVEDILYSYPVSNVKIFFAKLIVIFSLITIIFSVTNILTYGGYYYLYKTIDYSFAKKHIIFTSKCVVFQFAAVMLPIIISQFYKNILLSVIYAVSIVVSCTVVQQFDIGIMNYLPMYIPYFYIGDFYYHDILNTNLAEILGVIYLFSGIIISFYLLKRRDIKSYAKETR